MLTTPTFAVKWSLSTSLNAPVPGEPVMRLSAIPLVLLVGLSGCKAEKPSVDMRSVRTVVVDPRPIHDDRHAVGEVKPRYESDLSFRVAGKVLTRLVDVGAAVRQGDTLATLDTQDFENRLRSAEADVTAAQAALVEAQATEARKSKLLTDGWTPQANYDTALRNLRSAEARLNSAKANLGLTRDQLHYTTLKAEFDGLITAVGAEAGQNVAAGQMVVKLARPGDKDAVFNIAEAAFTNHNPGSEPLEVIVWPLANPELKIEGVVREISPVADSATRTYTVKVTLKDPPPQLLFGMSIAGRLKRSSGPVVALPLSALFEKNGSPAVWVFDQDSGSVALRTVTVSRYETDTAVIADGLAKGDIVVTAGINTLREGQKVRVAAASANGSTSK
jgi:RND family efflux transporter MFP subunit